MSRQTERNKDLVRAHYRAISANDAAALERQVAEDFYDHPAGARLGPEGVKRFIAGLHASFRDLTVTIDDILAEDDRVAVRATWRGTHASGKPISFTGMVFWRVADDKIRERWACFDMAAMQRQLQEEGPGGAGEANGHGAR